jgi:hypothetical protein
MVSSSSFPDNMRKNLKRNSAWEKEADNKMEERKTVFDYMGQILMIFGFTILMLLVFSLLFGESAKGYSEIFSFGKEGIGVDTMIQFLLASIATVTLRMLFFTDMLFKNMRLLPRTAGMVFSELIVISIFVWLFNWFPVDEALPWFMFFSSFGICFVVSLLVTVLQERIENKRMEDALESMKKKMTETERSMD